jgi:hypothetical protein
MRRDSRSVSATCGYALTEYGRDGLRDVDTCQCTSMVVQRGTFCCLACGTVYGVLSTVTDQRNNRWVQWQVSC